MRRRWKIAALVGPFLVGYALLYAWGARVDRYFKLLFAGEGARETTHRGIRIIHFGDEADAHAAGDILADHFERVEASDFGRRWGLRVRPDLALYLFPTHEDMGRFAMAEVRSSLENNGGYYRPGVNQIVLVRKDVRLLTASLRHEGTHAVCASERPAALQYPPWLSEGLAQYFEMMEDGRRGGIDPISAAIAAAAMESSEFSIDALLGASQDAFSASGNAVSYAVSVAVVATLDQDHEKFLRFVEGGRFRAHNGFEQIYGDGYNLRSAVREFLGRRLMESGIKERNPDGN